MTETLTYQADTLKWLVAEHKQDQAGDPGQKG
jgi:hypothetical protein